MPYQDTPGWSGSETSKSRAEYMVASGLHETLRQAVLFMVTRNEYYGLTLKEAKLAFPAPPEGPHHGSVSATFTNLFREGEIIRLTAVREGNKVYVAPPFVGDRTYEVYVAQHQRLHGQVRMLTAYLDLTDPDWREKVVSTLRTAGSETRT